MSALNSLFIIGAHCSVKISKHHFLSLTITVCLLNTLIIPVQVCHPLSAAWLVLKFGPDQSHAKGGLLTCFISFGKIHLWWNRSAKSHTGWTVGKVKLMMPHIRVPKIRLQRRGGVRGPRKACMNIIESHWIIATHQGTLLQLKNQKTKILHNIEHSYRQKTVFWEWQDGVMSSGFEILRQVLSSCIERSVLLVNKVSRDGQAWRISCLAFW